MEKTAYLDLLAQYGVNCAHPGGFLLTKKLLERENITRETALLDVGCGTGLTSAYIGTRYPCSVTAVDINPLMLEKAEENFKKYHLNIPLIRADVMDLPFHKNSFDIILAESVTIFTKIHRTLREYYRVLKPEGILLDVEVTAIEPLTKDEAEEFQSVLGINYLPTKDDWCKMFREAGFSDVRVLSIQKFGPVGSFSPEINRAFHEYMSLMRRCRNKIMNGVYRCALKSRQ